jgi:ABC-type amino acid transport substrate-binding protein
MSPRSSRLRRAVLATLATTLLAAVAACGGGADAATGGDGSGGTTVQVGALSDGAATETPITVTPVEEIRATLPQAIRDSGTLTIGSGTLPAGSPPLGYTGTDQQTLVGSEPDLARLVVEWQAKLQSEGKDVAIQYYPDINAVQLALASNQIDAYLGPNPGLVYQVKQAEGTPSPKKVAGTYSGAGESLQGLIAATVRKDSGLAQPLAAAINHLIENGQYAAWLQAWGLSAEAVPRSEVNPPGLPITNS